MVFIYKGVRAQRNEEITKVNRGPRRFHLRMEGCNKFSIIVVSTRYILHGGMKWKTKLPSLKLLVSNFLKDIARHGKLA